MKGQKILNKKLQKVNILKGRLVSRDENTSKEDIVEDIKEAVEDIELVLEDINEEDNEEGDMKDWYKKGLWNNP